MPSSMPPPAETDVQFGHHCVLYLQWMLKRSSNKVLIRPGPEFIKLFSCSTQLSMTFFLLINVKMPTIVGILTFMSRKNSILDLSKPKKAEFLVIFILLSI